MSESELLEGQIPAEHLQQQQVMAQAAAAAAAAAAAGGGGGPGSPQRNYYVWKDQPVSAAQQQMGKAA